MSARAWILGATLVALGSLKVVYNPYPIGNFAIDGSYYYQVARHVANGDGLLTDVSLYHQGLSPLPHPSPIYPVWPLVLGGVGAVVGLHTAAVWLPELLYLASLVLLYQLTVAIGARMGEPTLVWWRGQPLVDIGHLLVVLFGCNAIYFRFTSLPFTEGLAFTLAFGMLLAYAKCDGTRSAAWGALAGLLGALSYLTRSQFLGLALAPLICLALLSWAHPSLRRTLTTAIASTTALILAQVCFLVATFTTLTPRVLLDFTAFRENSHLQPFVWMVDQGSLLANLVDRAKGVYVAFSLTNFFSYVQSFGWVVYTIPLAVLAVLSRPRALKARLAAAYQPRTLVVTATIAAALASLAPVHAMHATMYGGWFFQWRHGLPLVFSLTVAIAFLLSAGAPLYRLAALALIAVSIWSCAHKVRDEISNQSRYHAPTVEQVQFREWIERQSPETLFLATATQVNTLAAITGGHFHSVSCIENPEQVGVFFDELQVDYLVTGARDQGCQFFKSISERLEGVMRFGTGKDEIVVWRRDDRRGLP